MRFPGEGPACGDRPLTELPPAADTLAFTPRCWFGGGPLSYSPLIGVLL
jgi:hypothetical protein